jgi:hypothetical protein
VKEVVVKLTPAMAEAVAYYAEEGMDGHDPVPPDEPDLREGVARIVCALRSARRAQSDELRVGRIVVDTVAHTVRFGHVRVALKPKEYALFVHLARNPERAFSRDELMDELWGDVVADERTVDVHVRRLRRKLGQDVVRTVQVCDRPLRRVVYRDGHRERRRADVARAWALAAIRVAQKPLTGDLFARTP